MRKQDIFVGNPKRVFHQRFTLAAKCGLALCVLLMFYFFWIKTAIVSLLLLIVGVGMIERVLHTTYTIGLADDQYFLLVDKGRFSFQTMVPVNEISRVWNEKRPLSTSRKYWSSASPMV